MSPAATSSAFGNLTRSDNRPVFSFGNPPLSDDRKISSPNQPATPPAAATPSTEAANEVEAECSAEFSPVVKLKEVEVDSGEGDEEEIYREMCLLYRFETAEKAWKTRGKGYVKLLRHDKTRQVRIVLREDKTLKLRMNHFVNSLVEMKPTAGSEKSWTWATTDYSNDGAASEETFAIKFRSEELASEFKRRHDDARALNGAVTAVPNLQGLKTVATIVKIVEKPEEEKKEAESELAAANMPASILTVPAFGGFGGFGASTITDGVFAVPKEKTLKTAPKGNELEKDVDVLIRCMRAELEDPLLDRVLVKYRSEISARDNAFKTQ
jgi:Ran-binding protein 1